MKYINNISKHCKAYIVLIAALLFSACAVHKDAFIYPDLKGVEPIKEVKAPPLTGSASIVPESVKKELKDEFVPPPLAPQFSKMEAEAAQEKRTTVDDKFSYQDKPLTKLIESFPFIAIKKLSRLEYFEHEIEVIREIAVSHPATIKHFEALNALKEGYIFYTKKSKLYRKISKKLKNNEKVSDKQAAFVENINNMYSILRDVLINEKSDYRLKENAIRYMEEMKGKLVLDFFMEDALEEISSSKDAPASLVSKVKDILEKSK